MGFEPDFLQGVDDIFGADPAFGAAPVTSTAAAEGVFGAARTDGIFGTANPASAANALWGTAAGGENPFAAAANPASTDLNQMSTESVRTQLADDGRPAPAALLSDCCGLASPTRSQDGLKTAGN